MDSEVRVRFAPSPTGYLHVGGARTALFNYLFARSQGGKFLLRIEDTDRKRWQEDSLEEIFQSLKWLGIEWDEGPDVGGDSGPYVQSERIGLYRQLTQRLLDGFKAYRCFCTEERLAQMREEQQKNKKDSISGYDRRCRDLSEDEIQEKLDNQEPYVVRFKIPTEGAVLFQDLIRGGISYNCDVLDDIVLMKTDGFPTYHLANVVDDHHMNISHVLRGDEWIASTPRHLLLYKAFGWEPPQFAHMPLILDENFKKLSKRAGDASVLDFKKAGILPEALINFLSLLGWSPGEDREIMNLKELEDSFSLIRVSPKASVFDKTKLEWMNGHYMRERSVESIYPDVKERWEKAGRLQEGKTGEESYLKKVVTLLKDRSKTLSELVQNSEYFFSDPTQYNEKAAKKHFKPEAAQRLKDLIEKLEPLESFDEKTLEGVYQKVAETTGLSGGKLIHPTRLAISGVSSGPGLFELMEALGKEWVIGRMKKAVEWIEQSPKSEE